MACDLCDGPGGKLLFDGGRWRVVAVEGDEARDYPGFCRVVWNAHVREMTDLADADRDDFMRAVFAVETALRDALKPLKVNLASLGNLTPHLHWHVIPRYATDPAFPRPIWAPPLRAAAATASQEAAALDTLGASLPDGVAAWPEQVRRALQSR